MAKLSALTLLGVLVAVFVVASAEEQQCGVRNAFKEAGNACKDEISKETHDALKDDYKLDNEEVRKFRVCLYNHMGFMKEGKFDVEAIKAKVDENVEDKDKAEKFKAKFENCAAETEGVEPDTEAAAKFFKCTWGARKAQQTEE